MTLIQDFFLIQQVLRNFKEWILKGFPCNSVWKESACNVGDLGSIPRLGRSPGKGKGYPLHRGSQRVGHN